mgnify:CR=1 FL=1
MNGRNGTAVALTMVLEGLGYSIYGAIFGVYLFELKASFTELALLTAIPNATALFLSRFWGIISDESHARKPFILWGKYVAAFFVFIYSLTTNVKEILILFILASLITSPAASPMNAIITSLGGREKRGRSIGLVISASALGWMLGSFISAMMVKFLPINYLFILASIILLLSAIIFQIGYKEDVSSYLFSKHIFRIAFNKAFSFVEFKADRELFPLIYAMLIYYIGVTLFFHIFGIKYYIVIGRDMSLYALVGGISAFFSVIAPPFYGYISDIIGRDKLLVIMIFVRTIYMIMLTIIWDPLILTILWVLPIWAGIQVSARGLATDILGDERAGRAQGTFSIARNAAAIIGSITSGILADFLHASENIHNAFPVLLLGIILCAVSGVIVLIRVVLLRNKVLHGRIK